MSRRRKSKAKHQMGDPIDLNVMPFVDVFSLLTTFLLFTATYVQIGVLEVQVPFFSNKPPVEDQSSDKPKRVISVNVRIDKENIEVESYFKDPPRQSKIDNYSFDLQGIDQMHDKLVELRTDHPDTDLVYLYVEDDVVYSELVKAIDAIKFLDSEDGSIVSREKIQRDSGVDPEQQSRFLFKKIVLGSVIF